MKLPSLLFMTIAAFFSFIDAFDVEYCYAGGWSGSSETLDPSLLTDQKCVFTGQWCRTKYNRYGKLAFSECASKILCKDNNGYEMRNACRETPFGEVECCCDTDLCLGSGARVRQSSPDAIVVVVPQPAGSAYRSNYRSRPYASSSSSSYSSYSYYP